MGRHTKHDNSGSGSEGDYGVTGWNAVIKFIVKLFDKLNYIKIKLKK